MTGKKSITPDARRVKPHHYEFLNTTGNIVLTTVKGPIDLATVTSATQINIRCFKEIEQCNIGCIFVVENSMHITEEARSYYTQILQQHKADLDKNIYVAYVAEPDVVDRAASCALLKKIYGSVEIPFQSFTLLEDAMSWLNSVLKPELAG